MRVLALVLTTAIALPIRAQQVRYVEPTSDAVPTVTASGAGEVRITPDRATLSIGVETKGPTAAQASAENARKQRAVIDAIKSLGVADQQISTVEYNVYPEQSVLPDRGDRTPRIIGYTVSNTVRVEVQRLDRLGPLIDAALGKGANAINSLVFSSTEEDKARRSALSLAVERARGDAEAMAKGAGGSLGDLIEVSSQAQPGQIQPFARMAMAAPATPISPGSETVSVTVTTRWRFVREK